jgi:hypothetical protein
MNDNEKSDLLDMSDAETLSERDKDSLKSALRAGKSTNPGGIARVVMTGSLCRARRKPGVE